MLCSCSSFEHNWSWISWISWSSVARLRSGGSVAPHMIEAELVHHRDAAGPLKDHKHHKHQKLKTQNNSEATEPNELTQPSESS